MDGNGLSTVSWMPLLCFYVVTVRSWPHWHQILAASCPNSTLSSPKGRSASAQALEWLMCVAFDVSDFTPNISNVKVGLYLVITWLFFAVCSSTDQLAICLFFLCSWPWSTDKEKTTRWGSLPLLGVLWRIMRKMWVGSLLSHFVPILQEGMCFPNYNLFVPLSSCSCSLLKWQSAWKRRRWMWILSTLEKRWGILPSWCFILLPKGSKNLYFIIISIFDISFH